MEKREGKERMNEAPRHAWLSAGRKEPVHLRSYEGPICVDLEPASCTGAPSLDRKAERLASRGYSWSTGLCETPVGALHCAGNRGTGGTLGTKEDAPRKHAQ